jgi:hypothetical protein
MASAAAAVTTLDRPPQLGITPTRLSFQCAIFLKVLSARAALRQTLACQPGSVCAQWPLLSRGVFPAGTREEPGQLLRLRLTNRSADRPTMYKVKTTAPKRYRVNPNAAEIQPGQTVEVKGAEPGPCLTCASAALAGLPPLTVGVLAVLLLAMEDYPEPARRRDRFLIQAAWSESSDVDVPERVSTGRAAGLATPSLPLA